MQRLISNIERFRFIKSNGYELTGLTNQTGLTAAPRKFTHLVLPRPCTQLQRHCRGHNHSNAIWPRDLGPRSQGRRTRIHGLGTKDSNRELWTRVKEPRIRDLGRGTIDQGPETRNKGLGQGIRTGTKDQARDQGPGTTKTRDQGSKIEAWSQAPSNF